jgi:hypothetical protein
MRVAIMEDSRNSLIHIHQRTLTFPIAQFRLHPVEVRCGSAHISKLQQQSQSVLTG